AGPPTKSDGDIMVPIKPKGWIDIVDLGFKLGQSKPRAAPSKPRASSKESQSPAAKAAASPSDGEPQQAHVRVVQEASRIARDMGQTAQDVLRQTAKTGYEVSSKVAQAATAAASKAQEAAPGAWEVACERR
ncbi:unnamed protein product, partial [Polarella glacialis]